MIPGIRDRVLADLRCCRPFKSELSVKLATEPVLGSWIGAREWLSDSSKAKDAFITKAMYEEHGGEYFIEHTLSNKYYPTPDTVLSK